jgi:kinesin family protein 3/17
MSKKENNNVSVGVRVRPRNQKEIDAEMPVYFTTSSDNVQELDENGVVVKHWSYDHVFGPECTNMDIFQTMGLRLVDAAMEGYNTVMFMYGQTSSG